MPKRRNPMMSRRAVNRLLICVTLLTVALAGCSRDLSRSRAAGLIEKHKEFASIMELKVPVGNLWWDWRNMNDWNPTYPFQTLKDRGILTIRESGQKEGYWNKEFITELTAKGKALSRNWVATKENLPNGATFFMGSGCWTTFGHGEPCHAAKGVVYSVVLAQRRVNQVTGITADPAGKESEAEFDWEWAAAPDAKNFPGLVPTDMRKGRGDFQLYDDGWRLTHIQIE